MLRRQDLLSKESPENLEVYQLTTEEIPSCHIYMEAQIFTPDSRAFLLHRSARPHGSESDDPEHRYLLCNCESGELLPVTDEVGATSPSVSPDGRYFYYFVTQSGQFSDVLGGRITLRRRELHGGDPVDMLVLDGRVPGTRFRLSRLYPLSTISSDGKHLAVSGFLGDGVHEAGSWGLWVIDLETGESWMPVIGPTWTNMHPQYCRSREPGANRDILIQENHGSVMQANGDRQGLAAGSLGADIHVVRDDGQHWRSFPWGRARGEQAQGHQCWRGRGRWAVSSTNTTREEPRRHEGWLLEALPVPFSDHLGRDLSGERNRLCQGSGRLLSHFATDESGRHLITDSLENPMEFLNHQSAVARDALYLFTLGEVGNGPARNVQFLLHPRTSWCAGAHAHPFLSPDGRTAFFNSDESGVMQAYMIKNIPLSEDRFGLL